VNANRRKPAVDERTAVGSDNKAFGATFDAELVLFVQLICFALP
jgi:hypothetical protein